MGDFYIAQSESEYDSSEEELQEAFAKGLLKTGLNEVLEQKVHTNNVAQLKLVLKELKSTLPWVETLDLVNATAAMAPEIAAQIKEQQDKRVNEMKNNKKLPQMSPEDDPVLNDFKREMNFHRQAQASVVEGLARLKQLGIATKRPDDFFAEMAKTDEHMHKIREHLVQKQSVAARMERAKQLRAQRKMGKTLQAEARVKKANEKKQMLDQVKKFRKGMQNDLDFLDDNKSRPRPTNDNRDNGKSKKNVAKQKYKDKKFGFGGKKRGSKQNTRESFTNFSENSKPKISRKNFKGKGAAAKRPGKNRRLKNKSNR